MVFAQVRDAEELNVDDGWKVLVPVIVEIHRNVTNGTGAVVAPVITMSTRPMNWTELAADVLFGWRSS